MPVVEFADAAIAPVEVEAGTPLLDGLLQRKVNAKMLCGRRGICATCHVYVEDGAGALSPRSSREDMALMMLTAAQPNSRLSCQAQVLGDGVRVRMPEGMYIESSNDLQALIGQRTSVPILHPVTGDILIEANKIIVRSMIMKLADTDFSPDEAALKKLDD